MVGYSCTCSWYILTILSLGAGRLDTIYSQPKGTNKSETSRCGYILPQRHRFPRFDFDMIPCMIHPTPRVPRVHAITWAPWPRLACSWMTRERRPVQPAKHRAGWHWRPRAHVAHSVEYRSIVGQSSLRTPQLLSERTRRALGRQRSTAEREYGRTRCVGALNV